jgi:arylsulfatase A-like enzyme
MNCKRKTPNVIVLVIDSLCFKRLGYAGNRPSPSPNLDALFRSGLIFSNCFAVGCPSDFGLLGLMTSSLPLDFGGYAKGLKHRPRTLAEVLKENGYATSFFTPLPYPPEWGNRRGYDDLGLFYDMGSYLVEVESSVRWYHDLAKMNPKSRDSYVESCADYLGMLFEDILRYCETTMSLLEREQISRSLMIHDYDFFQVIAWMRESLEALEKDRKGYVEGLWQGSSTGCVLDRMRAIVEERRRHPKTLRGDEAARNALRLALADLYVLSVMKRTGRSARWQARLRLQRGQDVSVRYPSARYTLDNMMRWIDRRKQQPFLSWAHLMDVHEMNFSSFDVPEASRDMAGEIARVNKHVLKISGQILGYNGNPLYDLAIGYVDMQIARLVSALRERGLLDNTLLLLTADHGHTHVAWPVRKDVHVTSHFYDELYHVPVAFVGTGIEHRDVRNLTSAMDMAPTLLGLLGLPSPSSFTGFDLHRTSDSEREHVIMEHMGSGHGDFHAKTILMCVRSHTDKIVYIQSPPREAKPGHVREWYCLRDDPQEKVNLASSEKLTPEAMRLVQVAQRRLARLYQENQLGPVTV